MKAVIPTRIYAGFILAMLLLPVVGIYMRTRALEFRQYREEAAHSRNLLNALETYLATVEDAETGQRGFLLVGDESYLFPYKAATATVGEHLARIEELTRNDPSALPFLQQLKTHTAAKLSELEATIRERREHSLARALAIVNTNVGNREMDAIRRLVADMTRSEKGRLELNEEKYAAAVAQADLLFMLAIAGQLVLLLLLFFSVRTDLHHRAASGTKLLLEQLRLAAVLNTIGEGLYQLDTDGKLVYINPAGQQMLGYELDEIRGKSMHELIHSVDPDGTYLAAEDCPLVDVIANGETFRSTADWFRRKDGSFLMVQYTSSPLMLDEKIQGAVLSFWDISESHRMQEAMRKSEDRYRNLVENSSGLICTHDLNGILISVNKAAAFALGYEPEELRGKSLREILVPDERQKMAAYLALIAQRSEFVGLMTVQAKDGTKHIWSYANRLVDDGNTAPYVLGYAQDVTEQMEAQEELKEHKEKLSNALDNEKFLSRSDHLTGLANRRAFEETLKQESKRSQRYKRPITLAYLDLDDFKKVNDEQGHHTGDELLMAVAATMQAQVRGTDVVARLGGDEFAMMLPETGEAAARVVMRKVEQALKTLASEKRWLIGFSWGVVTFPIPPNSIEVMLGYADELMYKVKRGGKRAILFETAEPANSQKEG